MGLMRLSLALMIALLIWASPPISTNAADSASVLTARQTGVPLYSRQDPEADRVATLEKDEKLTPLAESIGSEVWYMVRTSQGLTGWVRGADVVVSDAAKEAFQDKQSGPSTWSARTSDGRAFSGTWTVAPNSTNDSVSGAWTLSAANGVTAMRGTWSADKHPTGWNGVWHAAIEGRETQYSGSWSADYPYMRNTPLRELFAAAAKQAINGLWTGGSQSGSWSIRVSK